jgi:putative holliday junction resolvase
MQTGDYLGLDVGARRTGVARASAVAKLAEPLKILDTDKAIAEIKDLIEDYEVSGVIIGLPRNLDGNDTAQTAWVKKWADGLRLEIKAPIHFQDEALTSELAQTRIGGDGYKDDEAASIILQEYLDGQLNTGLESK